MLYHPHHWPMWVGVALLWALVRLLPWRWLVRLGEGVGRLLHPLARERRRIAETNIRLCFPELDEKARQRLVKDHFRAMGAALFETPFGWWATDEQLASLEHVEGLEHLQEALAQGKGVLLLSAHFTSLEICGRLILRHQPLAAMYRANQNPVVEYFFRRNRERHCTRAIRRDQAKEVIRTLRQGEVVWYAPDQAFKTRASVIVPFFGQLAATNPATSRLAKITGAPVVPFFGYRLPGNQGYRVVIHPPLKDFPGESPEADATRINQVIEEAIRTAPEQYFWTHRRFKYKKCWGIPDPYRPQLD
ncbi:MULTISPECIES: LpxL/LpxP family Kdo(2)-lipid IV(A) lauroyl/palmitoleoyl acyltransferase [unclassified Ectothiorhodospira]|uniref:LpxL/LpxP family Kdo(2)-lipid IV(A) lauroyl/palmitoleoyl acyltransferase n=1 Tax=unclassified Ectothiorhodospira TaxID=2684909 RepID=UPI002102E335|nr:MULTISPECIES: LpxL/LpxP family Kdo(2)-lipid IV(A) lauroyl/palmitoleoyl acyltransferase [unclassified Ectothiorhodospira]